MPNLVIEMLPAKEGDCLLVEYGPAGARKHVLIDGGRLWTYRNALKDHLELRGVKDLELLVVTHVDRDHIEGMLALFKDAGLALGVKNVWFNTYAHLLGDAVEVPAPDEELESFGAKMGEALSPLIVEHRWPWNVQFKGFAAALENKPAGNAIELGGATFTLLSPDRAKLLALQAPWRAECAKAGIKPGAAVADYVAEEEEEQEDEDVEALGSINVETLAATPFVEDHTAANGSSIAFIFEHDGRKVLFAGDSHVDVLVRELKTLGASKAKPLAVDAFKIPHHGSQYNLSRELLELLACKHYLVSTNGNHYYHPDDVAMARLVKFGTDGATIHFNYKTGYNRHWGNASWERKYQYTAEYPHEDNGGYKRIEL